MLELTFKRTYTFVYVSHLHLLCYVFVCGCW